MHTLKITEVKVKRPWCWGRLKAGGEGDDRVWDGWMASLTWSPGVGVGQGSLVCCSPWASQRGAATEHLNWSGLNSKMEAHSASMEKLHGTALLVCMYVPLRTGRVSGLPTNPCPSEVFWTTNRNLTQKLAKFLPEFLLLMVLSICWMKTIK